MTVPSEINRSGPYNGNGVTTVFDYDFRIIESSHLHVIKANAAGVETTLALTTDYTVSGAGDAGGGSITVLVAPATGETITILRNMPFTQETDLENQGAYYAETVEDALDAAAMRDQQLAERMNRAVLLPASADDSGSELSAQLAAGILRLSESANEIDTVASISTDVTTVAGIATDVALLADNAAILSGTASAVYASEDVFVGDGVDTTWTLSTSPASEANVDVWIGGAIQKTTDFVLAGNVLTIAPAVANGVQIIAKTRVQVSANDVYEARDEAMASEAAAAAAAAAAIAAAGSLTFATIPEQRAGSAPNRISSPYTVTDAFKYRGFVSPLDFGPIGVGNDITTGFLAACAAPDIFAITIPPGIWNIADQGLVQNKPFTVKGFGKEVTQLHVQTAGKNAVRFISTGTFARWNDFYYRTIALNLEGLAIVSPITNPAAGVYAEWVDFVDETCFFSARDVKVMTADFTHSFATGIHLKNCNGTILDDVHMVGDSSRRSTAGAAPYAFGTGVYWECGTAYPKVSHVIRGFRCRDMNTAFKMTGWSEGFYFNNCDPVLVGRCFDWDGYSVAEGGVGNPNLHITQTHLNFREHGIVGKDIYNVFIDDVDFLKDGDTPASVDGSCVKLTNTPIVSITNNRFGRAAMHTGIVRGVEAADNINGYRLLGNFFDGMNTESVNFSGTGQKPLLSNNVLVGAGGAQVAVRAAAGITQGSAKGNTLQGTFAINYDVPASWVLEGNSPQDATFTFTSLDTTPSVGGKNTKRFYFVNAAATNVTTFDDGNDGQEITVIAQNGNTTLMHSVSLILQGAVNWTMPAGATSKFYKDGASWRQESRTIV